VAWVLTALTIGWNSLEAASAIVSRRHRGLDRTGGLQIGSVVEVSSALIIA
jgi:hypothetical protein